MAARLFYEVLYGISSATKGTKAGSGGTLKDVFKHIDSSRDDYIQRLKDAVAIESVSAEMGKRPDVVRMVHWTKQQLELLDVECELCPLKDPLPPVLFGTLGKDPKKKTVLIYGHLDVQPAKKIDGWSTEPFELTEVDAKLVGRGSSDDKGPVMAWINALESMRSVGLAAPVNIKFVFEAMEESGSEGLDELLKSKKDFLTGVDYVCISDNYWLGPNKPCLTYGLRGICYYEIEVTGPATDLHSGLHGGVTHEPMQDLIWMMQQLSTEDGHPTIVGLNEMVSPLTDEEKKLYEGIEFDVKQYGSSLGGHLRTTDKVDILMRRWRYPSLSMHGIQGAFSGEGAKTVIPCKVSGKFSIRIVPNMQPDAVTEAVKKHLNSVWEQRKSPNKMRVNYLHGGKPWLTDPKAKNFQAAHAAIKKVYGVDPDYTREGGSIPVTLTFQELTGVPVLLLPIGSSDDNPHAQNEKINIRNYIEGSKLKNETGKLNVSNIQV